jgi:hypothetical protein
MNEQLYFQRQLFQIVALFLNWNDIHVSNLFQKSQTWAVLKYSSATLPFSLFRYVFGRVDSH